MRGTSFAFRKVVATTGERRVLGGAFAISSVLVPYCMGAIAGGIASGRVPAGGQAGDPVDSWINPTSVLGGVLAVAVAAYLAAVYLIWDVRRAGDTELTGYFRRRAMAAAVAAAVIAAAGILVLRADARYLFDGLTSRALPLVLLSVACGAGALVLLVRDATRGARLLAVVAVASIVGAWGVAQWPYLLPESLTVAAAAAPSGTLTAVLVAVALAAVLVLPGFALLYTLDQKGLLPEEGARADVSRGPRALGEARPGSTRAGPPGSPRTPG
jgi:cytochrome d ubiquinol oxidase subunit II